MTIQKSSRAVFGATLALVTGFVGFLVYDVAQEVMLSSYEGTSKTSGLAVGEVGFDIQSSWAQRSVSGSIADFLGLGSQKVAPQVTRTESFAGLISRSSDQRSNTEAYDSISDNPFVAISHDPLSTFSIDVDTASYANMRRFIVQGVLPPKDAVRIEELINYFTYDYPPPVGSHPIAVLTEVASAPWKPEHRLVRIGIKARDMDLSNKPASNLVFLIDVSGSMKDPVKLPLLKSAMKLLIDNLSTTNHVAIVVYAGSEGLVLPSTSGSEKLLMRQAIDNMEPGGSTNGAAGINLAYELAGKHFRRGGINRVILATDGDFNVGVTNEGDLVRLIESKAKSGVFLTVLGFGMGNIKDSTLEKLADHCNGNYAYIDSLNEARKVLVQEMGGTLVTVAKDVKIQVEFNPEQAHAYRLLGYENRILRHEDFNNDAKDAGDIGAGHTVTALFEVVPKGVDFALPTVDPRKYQEISRVNTHPGADELLNVKVRYKDPAGDVSQLIEIPVANRQASFANASADFRFAAAVASLGMVLRDSPHKGGSTLASLIEIAETSKGPDKNGYREEFIQLAGRVRALQK